MTERETHVTDESERRINAAHYESQIREGGERLKFQIDLAQSALKNLHLVNGGAIVALLTLIGNSKANFSQYAIGWAFVWFALGLSASLAAYFGAFYSQLFFMNASMRGAWNAQARSEGISGNHSIDRDVKLGNYGLNGAIFLAVSSLVFFIVGAFVALGGLF